MNARSRLLIGGIAGLLATGPMTVAMVLLHRCLPRSQKYPLPPRQITMTLAHRSGASSHMGSETRAGATWLGHFGYGTACGVAFTAMIDARKSAVGKGAAFGLAVWAVSYLGWLPATGILPPATQQPNPRNLLMIVAHLIWGATVGGIASSIQRGQRR